MVYIVMGVSGCGKSTIARMMARELDVNFYDADNFHPKENISKMSQSQALNCGDRLPWLAELAKEVKKWNERDGGAVLAYSSLKRSYRNILRLGGDVQFIYLRGTREVLASRMQARNSFMPLSLLKSQLETLEEPRNAITVDIQLSPEEIIDEIFRKINQEEKHALYH